MKPEEIPATGVLFVRVRNGWRVIYPPAPWEDSSSMGRESVFQDSSDLGLPEGMAEAMSLRDALFDAFDEYSRSKHKAGIVIEARPSRTTEAADG